MRATYRAATNGSNFDTVPESQLQCQAECVSVSRKEWGCEQFFRIFCGGWLFLRRKDHVSGFLALPTAIFDVEGEIIHYDVVVCGKAQLTRGLVYGGGRTFQLDEGSDGRFVQFDEQILQPIAAAAGRRNVVRYFS